MELDYLLLMVVGEVENVVDGGNFGVLIGRLLLIVDDCCMRRGILQSCDDDCDECKWDNEWDCKLSSTLTRWLERWSNQARILIFLCVCVSSVNGKRQWSAENVGEVILVF